MPRSTPLPIDAFISRLTTSREIGGVVAHHQVLPPRVSRTAPLPQALPAALQQLLESQGIPALYVHQRVALDHVRDRRAVIMATPTASGKSLAYFLPILESALQLTGRKAVYVSPLKALAQDQLRQFQLLADQLDGCRPSAAIYDGDTPAGQRRKIRENPPNLLLTNPEMLHLGLLPYHDLWSEWFGAVGLVVIDEVHAYRGVAGSHMAMVFRRFLRLCRHYGGDPALVFCSATVANPGELATRLTGAHPVAVVKDSGAPRGRRHIVLMEPLDGLSGLTIRLIRMALAHRLRTIVYTQSRKLAELLTLWVGRRAEAAAERVSVYRAGLLPAERRDIERRLASGQLLVVISTSALELGIDIGDLDLCILVGYPGSMVATWQRSGRVGRSGQPSALVMVAGEDALDRYYLRHPGVFMRKAPEAAVLNPHNPRVLAAHLECAAAEMPIAVDDPMTDHPAVDTALRALERQSVLLKSADGMRWHARRKRPQRDVDLRGAGDRFTIVNTIDDTPMGEIDAHRVYRETHPGAVYLHLARTFIIDTVDPETRIVSARPDRVDFTTRPRGNKTTDIIAVLARRLLFGAWWSYGRLKVTEQVTGYERWHIRDRRRSTVVPLDLPLQSWETEGVWLEIPPHVAAAAVGQGLHFMGGIHALEHAAIGMLPLIVLADRNDVGGIAVPFQPELGAAVVFIYEGGQGGAGLCEAAFKDGEALLTHTLRTISDCDCESGCPACIQSPKCGSGNRPLDKSAARFLLEQIMTAQAPRVETRPERPAPFMDAPIDIAPVGVDIPARRQPGASGVSRLGRKRLRKQGRRVAQATAAPMTATPGSERPTPAASVRPVRLPSSAPGHYAVLDIETQRSAQEVGGWHRADLMRVSVAVLYDSLEDDYTVYTEDKIPDLLARLKQVPRVVGFNINRFDYRVLSGYADMAWEQLPTVDLLEYVHRQLGFRLSLDHLAGQTLGAEKTADGLQALRWWKNGQLQEIIDYCRQDVKITRDLYRFGLENGYLLFKNKAGQQVRVPAGWATAPGLD
ncbi:MAG: DEAD/DEAH box helicase [Pseudomonadota bacterium]